ncbi:hypothetical protein AMECASPLE_036060 [Ameca splendens]|uniref:Uncharacterized protein n=1 Tax=Ameca splendens TaxID=208324 RepID=A0ABV0ZHC2_9TELE
MKMVLRVLHNVLHFMKNLSLHNDLQRFQRSPQNRARLLYQLVELFNVPGSDAASPADDGRRDHTVHYRLIEDMQHLAANTEGPKLPQEVQSALCLLVDAFTVAPPHRSVVQVNTDILILFHHLHFSCDRGLPQHWNLLLGQAKIEEVLQNPTELLCTGLQESRADIIWTSSLVLVQSFQLSL